MMWGLGGSDVTAESDVGSAYTLPNNVFGYWAFYSSYRDERWHVGKLVMCTFQIWPRKIFSFGWREIPGSDVTGRHGKRCYSSKQRLVSSQWVLFVERRAVARWKASSEEVLILIQIFFLHLDDAGAWRWEWRHSRVSARPKCLI